MAVLGWLSFSCIPGPSLWYGASDIQGGLPHHSELAKISSQACSWANLI